VRHRLGLATRTQISVYLLINHGTHGYCNYVTFSLYVVSRLS